MYLQIRNLFFLLNLPTLIINSDDLATDEILRQHALDWLPVRQCTNDILTFRNLHSFHAV